MDKRVLKKIAKEWAAGILYHGTGMDSLSSELGFSYEEKGYIVGEVHKIGLSIMKTIESETPSANLDEIVGKYYEFEDGQQPHNQH